MSRKKTKAKNMAEQLHAFAFPFQTKIAVNPESPLEEFPLQEISCQTPSKNDFLQQNRAKGNEGMQKSPLRELEEQKKKQEPEIKLLDTQEKEKEKVSSEMFSPTKSSIFNEERSPIHLNVETLSPQKEKTSPRETLFEGDLIDEDANHLLRYYH